MTGKRADVRPSMSEPKRFCIRGHNIKKNGFYWNRLKAGGATRMVRRCRLCAIEDVKSCVARRNRRERRACQ